MSVAEPPMPVEGAAGHWDHRVNDDHWEPPGNLFRLMTAEQQRLFDNIARSLGGAAGQIQERRIAKCTRADKAYGDGVARALLRLR